MWDGPRVDPSELADDLADEHDALDAVLSPLDAADWTLPTPSEGWSVGDQVAHLAWFDGAAFRAIVDPPGFVAERDGMVAALLAGEVDMDDATVGTLRHLSAGDLLAEWRSARTALLDAARTLAPGDRVEWYGPSMGAVSFLTARLMETWAHGQDVVDALVRAGRPVTPREPTDRLRHVAQLGVITRGWSHTVRGEELPDGEVRVELVAPDGSTWTWGPEGAPHVVSGPAEHFCLVVTQRRHPDDTDLHATNGPARQWLLVAQAFAGGATTGPPPGHA